MWKDLEIWSDVSGYPNYMVSTQGIVKNLFTNKALKPQDNGNGYKKLTLKHISGEMHQQYIHRIVAIHFCNRDDFSDKLEVDHINGIKEDNRADNLRWVTRSFNSRNYKGSRYSKPRGTTNFMSFEERHVILMLWFDGLSTVQIGRELGIPRQTVRNFLVAVGVK